MTLERCTDCRRTGLYHCSDPVNCGGMRMPTWDETNDDLEQIKKGFVALHDIGEKNWEIHHRDLAVRLRKRCIALGEYRYRLAQNERTN